MEEKATSSRRVYDGRVIKLDVLDVTLPNGQASQREIVKHPGAVAVVALDDERNILLVRQWRMAAERIMLEVPAGTLKPNEDPLVCADRELQEETGCKAGRFERLGAFFVAPGYTTEKIHLFLATNLSDSRLPMDDDEFIELVRIPLDDAIRRVVTGEIEDGKTITGILRAARLYGL
jgi:ADP-ribose pyrophosphatase